MRSNYLTLIINHLLPRSPPELKAQGVCYFRRVFSTVNCRIRQDSMHSVFMPSVIMLIRIADSEYFNIALKAYINEPNSKPLDIKEILCYPFSGQSEMFYTFLRPMPEPG